jgi:uncharacterized iron-regulated membrane protein
MRNPVKQRNRPRRRWISTKTWFAIHAWSGFKLGILMFLVFATGTLATISHELDWLADRELRVPVREADYDFAAVIDGIHAAYPNALIELIERPEAPGFAAVGRIDDPGVGMRHVQVDPHTGEVLELGHWYGTFQRFLRDLHRYLMLPGVVGMFVVGATAFLALASLISSFWIYPNWWRGFFRFKPGRSGDAPVFKEIHKLFGVWSLAFVLIMGVTGVWYVVEYVLALSGGDKGLQIEWVSMEESRLSEIRPGQEQLDPATIIAIAERELPGIRIGIIVPPTDPSAPYYIAGRTGEVLVRDRASHVFIDPYNGNVLARQHASELGPVRRWVDTADPLHFGDFAGLWSKIPYLIFGTGMTVLSGTGVWLRYQRIRRMFRRGPHKAAQARRARMRGWKWATFALLVVGAGFGSWQIVRYSAPDRDWQALGQTRVVAGAEQQAAAVFRSQDSLFIAFPPRVHFDPSRHRVGLPDCGVEPGDVDADVHHRVVRLPTAAQLDPSCLRNGRTAAGAANLRTGG